jgi:hypothetical protein
VHGVLGGKWVAWEFPVVAVAPAVELGRQPHEDWEGKGRSLARILSRGRGAAQLAVQHLGKILRPAVCLYDK